MHGIELVELARLAETYGDGDGPDRDRPELHPRRACPRTGSTTCWPKPLMQTYSPFPGPFDAGRGGLHRDREFCRFAVVETKERAVKWARALDAQLASADGDGQGPDAATPG